MTPVSEDDGHQTGLSSVARSFCRPEFKQLFALSLQDSAIRARASIFLPAVSVEDPSNRIHKHAVLYKYIPLSSMKVQSHGRQEYLESDDDLVG